MSGTMSTHPAHDSVRMSTMSSSASSQRTTTLVDSEISYSHQPWNHPALKSTYTYQAQQTWPRYPEPVHYIPGRPPSAYRPTTVSSINHSVGESSIHERGCSWGSSADWLRCMNGWSGRRTAHMKGTICVVLAVAIIFIVVLVLSIVGKKR
ncbi:hypothetical protein GGS21DRAFT_491726 [Xylaria nigripes]|nr:hypothetical protein GGS21DRAFT_491726 [Xylaria nigripes]